MTFQYDINDSGYRFNIDTTWSEEESEYIAEEAAKDYYYNHDGWEGAWPREITVYKNNDALGKYEVHLDYDPTFSAHEIELETTRA